MKICHIANYLPPYHKIWGGAEQGAIRIIELTRDKGNEIIVCTSKHEIDGDIINAKEYEIPVLDEIKNRTHFNIGFPVKYYKYYLNPKDKKVFERMKKILEIEKPDICHFHNIDYVSFSAIEAAKKLNIPSIITLYDYWVYCSQKILLDNNKKFCTRYNCLYCVDCTNYGKLSILKFISKLYYTKKKIAKKMLSYCDYIHVLSENSKKISMDYGIKENKILTLPTFFDFKDIKQNETREKHHIIFVGWFLYHKGIHIIIEAIGILKKKYPDIKFTAFGEALGQNKEYTESLYKRIKELDIEKNVNLAGKVPFSTVSEYLKKATAITISEQWHNMGPVILLESLAYKIPIVASNLGAMPEMLDNGNAGYLAEYNNPQDWADKIEDVIENTEKTKIIVENGFQRVKTYCDETTYYEKLNTVYIKMVEKKNR